MLRCFDPRVDRLLGDWGENGLRLAGCRLASGVRSRRLEAFLKAWGVGREDGERLQTGGQGGMAGGRRR